MSKKNETPILLLSLLITIGLVGAGAWFFFKKTSNSPTIPTSLTPSNSNNNPPPIGVNDFKQVPQIPTGLFNYGGSTSWSIIRENLDPAIQLVHPQFKLRYVEPIGEPASSSNGIKMLIDGKIALAQSSRPLKDQEYQQAKQRGFNLQQIAIAIDGIAVAVNPSLNISGLTIDQLKKIYTGQITNWQQLGGNNIPITPISRDLNSGGTVEIFVEEVLTNKPFAKNVEFVNNTTEALRKLANKPGGIYFASAPEVVPQCTIKPIGLGKQTGQFINPYQEPPISANQCPNQRNKLNITAFQQGSYPLTRNLFVVIKQNGQIEQQSGESYSNLLLSNQGQELIEKSGFVRVR
jgi:phosphate transport system substrate-binding protein